MKYVTAIAVALFLSACNPSNETGQTVADEQFAGEIVGNDRTPEGCIPSAGYQWSQAMEECVRIWEAGVELIHQGSGDPNYSAWAITAEDKAEIIINHDGTHALLTRTGDRSAGYIWENNEADMVLIADGDGVLQLQDANQFVMYMQEPEGAEPGFDEIPDHAADEAGSEIVWAKGIVKQVEDGAYPQFTLHIDLKGSTETTVFNLIAEGAELNGADLGLLDGKSVEIEYVIQEINELMGIGPKGSIKFEDIKSPGNWFFAEGKLAGADEESRGDLPDTLIIWEKGAAIRFDYFIDETLTALNEKDVSAWFMPEQVNDLSYLKVVE